MKQTTNSTSASIIVDPIVLPLESDSLGMKNSQAITLPNEHVEIIMIIDNNYHDKILKRLSSILTTTIFSLLNNRDFLGFQLDYQLGNINEEQFNSIVEKYLIINQNINIKELAKDILLLMKITSIVFDADQISVMFNCDINYAEMALEEIINNQELINA
jgi:hypothetical protein